MGYYTNFQLSVHSAVDLAPVDMEAVHVALDKAMDIPHDESAFENEDDVIVSVDSIKWYDHDEDCAQMSKQFPGVVFNLHGEGEDQGDTWEAYYKDGLCQICRALPPVFPPFDSAKLKSVQQAQSEDAGRP